MKDEPQFRWVTEPPAAGMFEKPAAGTYSKIPIAAITDARVTPAALRVLAFLGWRADAYGLVRFTSASWIADQLGLKKGRGHVQRHLRKLEELGYLARGWQKRPDRGGYGMNVYRIAYPARPNGGNEEIATSEPEIENDDDAANNAASSSSETVPHQFGTEIDAANNAAPLPLTTRHPRRAGSGHPAALTAAQASPCLSPSSSPVASPSGADDALQGVEAIVHDIIQSLPRKLR